MLGHLDLLPRMAELARTYGIDLVSVMTRGSQYRVEALMSRLAHSQNYLLPSPSRQQVATQPGMACLPLVMEPESGMYADPVVVLDFQSLYPSRMIAHNLCYSTMIGSAKHHAREGPAPQMGVVRMRHPPTLLSDEPGLDPEGLVIAPSGFAFAPRSTRPGILPRMLSELLATRVMVKSAMKRHPKSCKVICRGAETARASETVGSDPGTLPLDDARRSFNES
jgi:DNA polymerase zeta